MSSWSSPSSNIFPAPEIESVPEDHNRKGGQLYNNRQYEEAVAMYAVAIVASKDNRNPKYLSNLAATFLKLEKSTARDALRCDPRAIKARYRRVMARKGLGDFAKALVDLTSLLTTSPGHANVAVEEISDLHRASGAHYLDFEEVLYADFLSVIGSPQTLTQPNTVQFTPSASPLVPQNNDIGTNRLAHQKKENSRLVKRQVES
ncbi:hypothetical protein B0H13DRAFT_2314616 [Mycena leptocephala]|nr:hypothetical protein B0H13DRAFT_2314616 [Mycena leptocephala]